MRTKNQIDIDRANNIIKSHNIYTMDDLIKHYSAKTRGHWFDEATLKTFNCRIAKELYYLKDYIFFVTSEKGPSVPRAYSLRRYDTKTGTIDTIHGFCSFKTARAAHREAIRITDGGTYEL